MEKCERDRYVLALMPMVYKLAGKFGRPEMNDCVQEGVLGLIDGLDNYDENKGSLSSYVYPFIKGRIINFMNKSHKKYSELIIDNDDNIFDVKTISSIATDEALKKKEFLMKVINDTDLTELERKVVLATLQNISQYEIAKELKCSLNNVSRAKINAIKKIKESIKNEV